MTDDPTTIRSVLVTHPGFVWRSDALMIFITIPHKRDSRVEDNTNNATLHCPVRFPSPPPHQLFNAVLGHRQICFLQLACGCSAVSRNAYSVIRNAKTLVNDNDMMSWPMSRTSSLSVITVLASLIGNMHYEWWNCNHVLASKRYWWLTLASCEGHDLMLTFIPYN